MATTQSKFKSILVSVLAVPYFIWIAGAVICVPYYNWQYARQNGFVKWIFLGEVVPTLEAIGWPYFVVRSYVAPDTSKASVEHFWLAFKCKNEAFQKLYELNQPRNEGKLSAAEYSKKRAEIMATMNKSLADANLVNPSDLKSINADLPQQFIEWRKGIELLVAGEMGNDIEKTSRGAELTDNFKVWYDLHIYDQQ